MEEEKKEEEILHGFEEKGKRVGWGKAVLSAGVILVIVLAGVTTGYFLAQKTTGGSVSLKLSGKTKSVAPKEAGIDNPELFPDNTEGRVEVNDFGEVNEGSHKLLRFGGGSQTAYLTSTVVDLDQFVGECVRVWGETHAGQEAGWLMDVGRVKLLDKCPEGL